MPQTPALGGSDFMPKTPAPGGSGNPALKPATLTQILVDCLEILDIVQHGIGEPALLALLLRQPVSRHASLRPAGQEVLRTAARQVAEAIRRP